MAENLSPDEISDKIRTLFQDQDYQLGGSQVVDPPVLGPPDRVVSAVFYNPDADYAGDYFISAMRPRIVDLCFQLGYMQTTPWEPRRILRTDLPIPVGYIGNLGCLSGSTLGGLAYRMLRAYDPIRDIHVLRVDIGIKYVTE